MKEIIKELSELFLYLVCSAILTAVVVDALLNADWVFTIFK